MRKSPVNIYAVIILTTTIVDFVLNLVADRLNLKNAREELPQEFRGVYSGDNYSRSQKYLAETTRFSLIVSTFDLIVFLGFWFSGGFNILDQWIRGFGYTELTTGLLYIGVLMIAKSIISIPFSIYSTFSIEEKYGFNKTTLKTFVLDRMKGMLLGMLIGIPLLALILKLLEVGGDSAWLYAWGASTLFTLIIQYIAPTWIMPLFNKFKPIEDGDLKESVMGFADKVDFPLQGIYEMDGSKRSTKSNAFFTGFGKNKRIALFDTLIKNHTTAELTAVLAHEIGHYQKKHILKGTILGIAHTGILFYLLSIFLNHKELFEAFYMQQSSVYAGLLLFGLLYSPIELILGFILNALSRKNEYEADRFAAENLDTSEDMISALKKLSVDNLSNLTPHPFYVALHYSHPPVLQRIRALERAEN